MEKAKKIITMLVAWLLVSSGHAQMGKGVGIEFGFNGHIFDQAKTFSFRNIEKNYQYQSQAYVNERFEQGTVSRFTENVQLL